MVEARRGYNFKNPSQMLLTRSSSLCSDSTGEIQLIIGPMFSGKTTELFRRLDYLYHANRSTLLIRFAKDTRYSEAQEACTHNK